MTLVCSVGVKAMKRETAVGLTRSNRKNSGSYRGGVQTLRKVLMALHHGYNVQNIRCNELEMTCRPLARVAYNRSGSDLEWSNWISNILRISAGLHYSKTKCGFDGFACQVLFASTAHPCYERRVLFPDSRLSFLSLPRNDGP